MLIVQTTCAGKREAEKMALALVKEKLAACVTIIPCKSFFFWKGKLEKKREFLLEAKVAGRKRAKAEQRIRQLHPYSLPMIISISPSSVNAAFEKWVIRCGAQH